MSLAALDTYIARNNLILKVKRGALRFKGIETVEISIVHAGPPIKIVIFDEFGDAKEHNQALCLALLGLEIAVFGDAQTAHEWALAQSINPEVPEIQELFDENSAAIKDFLDRFGEIPDVISEWDWQLNAGLAQELRRCGA